MSGIQQGFMSFRLSLAPPGAPSSISYTTTSPTTLMSIVNDPATGSPFTAYRITTTPTTSTFTSSTSLVSVTGLTASTSYTLTGSVSNAGGYGPGLTTSSFTTAGSSWTTTGWGTLSSTNTFTTGAGPSVVTGASGTTASYATTNTLGSFYVLSGAQAITSSSNQGGWVAAMTSSGTISYAKKIDGGIYTPSTGAGGAGGNIYFSGINYTSASQEVPELIGISDSSGSTTYQKYYYNASETGQGMRTVGTGLTTTPAPYVSMGGRFFPPTAYAGYTGGAYIQASVGDGSVIAKAGFLDSAAGAYVAGFTSNDSYAIWVGYDSSSTPLKGLLCSSAFGTTGLVTSLWSGPSSNWCYFTAVNKDQSSASTYVFIQSTISNGSTSGGTRRLGITRMSQNGTQVWTRTLSSTNSLIPGNAIASDTSGNVYASGYNGTSGNWFIVKYNVSGTIQWQREFASNVAGTAIYNIASIALESTTYLSIEMQAPGTPGKTAYCRIPTDGTKTGTYNIGSTQVIYQATTYTNTSESFTLNSNPSYTMSNSWTWNATNSSLTISDANLSVQAVTV